MDADESRQRRTALIERVIEVEGPRGEAHCRLLGEEGRRGDRDQAAGRSVEVEGDENEEGDDDCGEDDGNEPPAENRDVEREHAQRERSSEQLEQEHRVRGMVVQPGESHSLLVDHRVQAVEVESRRAVAGTAVYYLTREPPELLLKPVLFGSGCAKRRAARFLVGDADRKVVVAAQERERATALGLADRLRAEVGGADRVRVAHDVGAAVLVAANGEREAEGEDEADKPEERSLESPIPSR